MRKIKCYSEIPGTTVLLTALSRFEGAGDTLREKEKSFEAENTVEISAIT